MIGLQTGYQNRFFYSFDLEKHIPQNHLLSGINLHLDLSGFRQHISECCSDTSSPSIDPELIIRMLIIGYSFGIRPERRLCEEVHLNSTYRWFCRSLKQRCQAHYRVSCDLFSLSSNRIIELGPFNWPNHISTIAQPRED